MISLAAEDGVLEKVRESCRRSVAIAKWRLSLPRLGIRALTALGDFGSAVRIQDCEMHSPLQEEVECRYPLSRLGNGR